MSKENNTPSGNGQRQSRQFSEREQKRINKRREYQTKNDNRFPSDPRSGRDDITWNSISSEHNEDDIFSKSEFEGTSPPKKTRRTAQSSDTENKTRSAAAGGAAGAKAAAGTGAGAGARAGGRTAANTGGRTGAGGRAGGRTAANTGGRTGAGGRAAAGTGTRAGSRNGANTGGRNGNRTAARTGAAAGAAAAGAGAGKAISAANDIEFMDPTKGRPKMTRKERKKAKKMAKKKKRSVKKRIFLFFLYTILTIIILAFIGAASFATYTVITADEIDPSKIYDQLNTTSIVYDDSGEYLDSISGAEARTIVQSDAIPDNLKNAFIAIEDKTFEKHHGFNVIRIFGAIRNTLFKGEEISGTSSITQQLARNLYLSSEKTLTRKIKEAYYTVILEKELSKEEILTAYLNTIFLGYNSCGVEAASKAYFGCDVWNLSLAECAVLAAIPKSPNKNSPLKRLPTDEVTADDQDVILVSADGLYTTIYNDQYIERQHLVLRSMLEQGRITQEEYDAAINEDIRAELNPIDSSNLSVSSYFIDYCINEVKNDLMKTYNIDENYAQDMIYNKGLKIYTSLDVNMQEIAEKEFEKSSNFPGVSGLTRDKQGNILDSRRNVMLYSKDTYFNSDGSFSIQPDEFELTSDGSIVIKKGYRLNIYTVNDGKPQIEFKDLYTRHDGFLYSIKGGYLKNLDPEYLSSDAEGNAVISSAFTGAYPGYFTFNDNGTITISPDNYELRQETIQPQGAMVINDYRTGQIKAMVGGRGLSGKMLYNRADQTRQPGSSIKPIAVYGPAIQSGVDEHSGWTAGSTVNDEAMTDSRGRSWPQNWYHGYKGYVSLRTCVQQSINTTAVKVLQDIGIGYSLRFLKKNGVTSVVESGSVNDMNYAALALGGMTNGISPIQMAAAYGTFPNGGIHKEPTTYTRVEDSSGNVILDSSETKEETQVYDEGVAWIMTDILRTVVTEGIAGRASIGVQPVGGKTGTTTDNYDAWFVGFTPQYAASVWIGNDVNIELSSGSGAAASLWARVMRQVCSSCEKGSFGSMPSNVYRSGGEYYVKGTERTGKKAEYSSKSKKKEETQKKKEPEEQPAPEPDPAPQEEPQDDPNPMPKPPTPDDANTEEAA